MRNYCRLIVMSQAVLLFFGLGAGCMDIAKTDPAHETDTAQENEAPGETLEDPDSEVADSDSAIPDTSPTDRPGADAPDLDIRDTDTWVPMAQGTDTQDSETQVPLLFDCTIEVQDETEATVTDAGVVEIIGEPKPTSVLFVFDKSGSMGGNWGGEEKWNAAASALVSAITMAHEVLGEKLRVGAILFPLPDGEGEVAALDSGHQIDFAPAEQFLATWQESASSNGPGGGTPLTEAFNITERALARECQQERMDHLYKIIVITDGAPNCGTGEDPACEALTRLPAKWLEHGIKTFVFGLPGSSSAEALLNDIAGAGGSDTYYAPYKETPDGGTEDRTADEVSDDIAIVTV